MLNLCNIYVVTKKEYFGAVKYHINCSRQINLQNIRNASKDNPSHHSKAWPFAENKIVHFLFSTVSNIVSCDIPTCVHT